MPNVDFIYIYIYMCVCVCVCVCVMFVGNFILKRARSYLFAHS